MIKIKNILVPTDFSDAALKAFRYAIRFADRQGAGIDLIHAVYPETGVLDLPVIAASATKEKLDVAQEAIKAFAKTGMAEAKAAYKMKKMPDVHSEVKLGLPLSIIKETAEEKHADLIIMGTQGEHSTLEKFIGSVTTAVLNGAECPVLVVPETAQKNDITTAVYAADLRQTDPYHIWETAKLLEVFNPILRVVHVVKKPDENKPVNMKELEDFFVGRTPVLQIAFHELPAQKDVTEELADFCDIWEVDLMVMHQPKRSFFERIFHRSTTNKEVFKTKVPLLVIK